MIHPWFGAYLSVSLAGLEFAEVTRRLWIDSMQIMSSMPPEGHAHESWLEAVRPDTAHWGRLPVVCNCAAAVYSAHGVDVSRMAVANAASRPAGRCRP
jgi:hypothetical protein